MTDAAGQPPRLGEVLVRHGVVTPQQLQVALEEQRQTGRPVGEIIVERGFAPGPMVAQALATQRGGLVKTEYGFATGFQSAPAAPAAPAPVADPRDEELQKLRVALASRDAEIKQLRELLDQLRLAAVA